METSNIACYFKITQAQFQELAIPLATPDRSGWIPEDIILIIIGHQKDTAEGYVGIEREIRGLELNNCGTLADFDSEWWDHIKKLVLSGLVNNPCEGQVPEWLKLYWNSEPKEQYRPSRFENLQLEDPIIEESPKLRV